MCNSIFSIDGETEEERSKEGPQIKTANKKQSWEFEHQQSGYWSSALNFYVSCC